MLLGGTWGTSLAAPATQSTTAGGATQIGRGTDKGSPTAQLGSGRMPLVEGTAGFTW